MEEVERENPTKEDPDEPAANESEGEWKELMGKDIQLKVNCNSLIRFSCYSFHFRIFN